MKLFLQTNVHQSRNVAPFAGAWIEISVYISLDFKFLSLPSRERGLKFDVPVSFNIGAFVAPFAGAWIEMGLVILILTVNMSRSLRGSVD